MVALNAKYVLERRLGVGGMAEVYFGRMVGAEGFSRPIAIKRVLEGLSLNAMFAQHFINEAKLCARLQHPNIVSVVDFDRDPEGRLFLVMELVDGVDLATLLSTGRLPFSVVIYLAIEILRGLDYAHALPATVDGVRGLVHRDMSPHNVLLSWEGAVKVSDFGIAKAREATAASASMIIKGKPAYMSPEQINGRPLDGRSDLFAVGAMLYEMLCGEVLFAGTPEESYGQVLHKPIPFAHDQRKDVPEDLSRVVALLLTRELDQRMPSAEAAIAALVTCADCPKAGREELIEVLAERFAGRAPVRARGVSSAVNAAAIQRTVTIPAPASVARAGRNAAPDPRWLWAALAAFLIVGGVVVALVASGRGGGSTAATKPSVTAAPTPAGTSSGLPEPKPVSDSSSLRESAPAMPAAAGSGSMETAPGGTATPPRDVPSSSNAPAVSPTPPTAAPASPAPPRVPPRAVSPPSQRGKSKSDGIQEIKL